MNRKYFCLLLLSVCCTKQADAPLDSFVAYFQAATKPTYSEEDFLKVFDEYNQLTIPYPDTSQRQTTEPLSLVYPLESFKNYRVYQENIDQLLTSSNVNHRMLAYLVIGACNDTTYSGLLLDKIKTETSEEGLNWSAIALMNMKDKHTTQLFDFLVEHEDYGDAHLIPMYLQLDKDSLIHTCRNKVKVENTKSKVLALQVLAHLDESPSTDSLVTRAVNTWDTDIKGYAIVALQMRKIANLKPILEPFIKEEKLKGVILQTLEKSPTTADSLYAAKIRRVVMAHYRPAEKMKKLSFLVFFLAVVTCYADDSRTSTIFYSENKRFELRFATDNKDDSHHRYGVPVIARWDLVDVQTKKTLYSVQGDLKPKTAYISNDG